MWRRCRTRLDGVLTQAPVTTTNLQMFYADKPVPIKTDVSKYAMAAVLGQKGVVQRSKPKKTTGREQQTPAYDSELRASVHARINSRQSRQSTGARAVTIEVATRLLEEF